MSLTLKEKELVYIGASVASGCKPCTTFHYEKALQTGASDEEIKTAISDALSVRDNANKIMENHALKLIGINTKNNDGGSNSTASRISVLVSIAAAFAVNCTSSLKQNIAAGRAIGISDAEIYSVLMRAGVRVKGEAASHVDRITDVIAKGISSEEKSIRIHGCGCEDDSVESRNMGTLRLH
ncbi:MAG: carboxymuconolactone decarboxylase family protein [Planctomycetota bacterium]|jgi:AhpD family alkylhydroperoxidase